VVLGFYRKKVIGTLTGNNEDEDDEEGDEMEGDQEQQQPLKDVERASKIDQK